MPYAAPRPCPHPGCPVLTNGGRCKEHQRAKHAAIDARRGSPGERGYDRAWQQLRKLKLSADPWCEIKTHCANLSLTQQLATEVDHIQTVRDFPELRLVWSNLRSACKRCHSARTASRTRIQVEEPSKRLEHNPWADFPNKSRSSGSLRRHPTPVAVNVAVKPIGAKAN